MPTYLWIGLGGFLGANARYIVQTWAAARWGSHFPYGTMLANVSGSFLLALFLTLATERFNVSSQSRLLVATGFLGGYTTFSSFGYETWRLLESGGWLWGGVNALGNLVLGAAGVILGIIVARWLSV